jgi:hypothetical protein
VIKVAEVIAGNDAKKHNYARKLRRSPKLTHPYSPEVTQAF